MIYGITIKKGDTLPVLSAIFKDSNGNIVDLTGATVTFTMSRNGTVKINAASCTIESEAGGEVSYVWVSGDTDTAGTYDGEFEVTNANGVFTIPTKDYIKVDIKDTL